MRWHAWCQSTTACDFPSARARFGTSILFWGPWGAKRNERAAARTLVTLRLAMSADDKA